MDSNQTRIVELLREVHLTALREIERLNFRIAELEIRERRTVGASIIEKPSQNPQSASAQTVIEVLDEKQAAAYLKVSTSLLRKWRVFRQGPKHMKIGRLVRYKRVDLESWFDSCSG